MKRINMLIGSLGNGGAEGVCITLANGFVDHGYDVYLIVLNLDNSDKEHLLDQRINLVNLKKKQARYSLFALAKILRAHRSDPLLVFHPKLTILVNIIRLLWRYPLRVVARNINTMGEEELYHKKIIKRRIERFLVNYIYSCSDMIVSQSEGMSKDLIHNYRIPRNKSIVIHNPVNPEIEHYFQTSGHKKSDNSEEYLIIVGRLEKQKAIHFALHAFARVVKSFPELKLKVVGEGSLQKELLSITRELGIDSKVDFTGYQSEMISLYKGARLTLLTSLYEGFPNVLVESVSLGTPVVSFDCKSGPDEIIKDGINGFLVENQDLEDLVVKTVRALNHKWNPKEIIKSGMSFKSGPVIEKYIDILIN